jgi:hypothetical protein
MEKVTLTIEDFLVIFDGFVAACDEWGHASSVQKVYEPVREKFQELYDKHYDTYTKLEKEKCGNRG